MPIKLKSTGGGDVTLDVPSTASAFTLTMPAVTDTVVGAAATQTLTNKSIDSSQLTGTINSSRIPSGTIIQVVSATKTSTASTASSTYADISGLSVSITPTKTTSKIVAYYTINCSHNVNTGIWVELRRDSTSLSTNWGYYGQPGNFTYSGFPMTLVYLDSPSSTSSLTYSLRWRSDVNGFTSYLNRSENGGQTGFTSTITVMEVAG